MVTPVPNHTGVITQLGLVVTGITANNKPFDGNTSATLNLGGAALVGVIAPDVVSLNTAGAVGTFSSSAVGTWTVTVAGLTLGGSGFRATTSLTQPTTTASDHRLDPVGLLPAGRHPQHVSGHAAVRRASGTPSRAGRPCRSSSDLFATAGGTELTSVSDVSGFALAELACSTGAEDPVDPSSSTTGATCSATRDGQFIQNWDTPKGANNATA